MPMLHHPQPEKKGAQPTGRNFPPTHRHRHRHADRTSSALFVRPRLRRRFLLLLLLLLLHLDIFCVCFFFVGPALPRVSFVPSAARNHPPGDPTPKAAAPLPPSARAKPSQVCCTHKKDASDPKTTTEATEGGGNGCGPRTSNP